MYRADDLILDQPVALKLLPPGVQDEGRVGPLHNELRVARQVSHKNVCRLYDLGEAGGRRFLTMEYIDGEDLASLIRRIGRLPHDKAVQISRQLCAAIAAAHERGVIHRDLKPANVMIPMVCCSASGPCRHSSTPARAQARPWHGARCSRLRAFRCRRSSRLSLSGHLRTLRTCAQRGRGPHPVLKDVTLRVEGAGYRGRPVFFDVIGPWTDPERMQPDAESLADQIIVALMFTTLGVLIVSAAVLARRHIRANRADRRGAWRVT